MRQRKFLITGATGKTGVYTINNLLEAGQAVRARFERQTSVAQRFVPPVPKS
jgi:NAD(P)H dehydrogenase (quinone)